MTSMGFALVWPALSLPDVGVSPLTVPPLPGRRARVSATVFPGARLSGATVLLILACLLGLLPSGWGQIDPVKRELIQVGYSQPLQGKAPISGYAFYYLNLPQFYRSNYAIRLAFAPIYADSELGIRDVLGPNTDLGIGLGGGGFADSYFEIHEGKYEKDQSFTGHGGNLSVSLYHLFNPTQRIPLYGVVRPELKYAAYLDDKDTASDFELPESQPMGGVRTGLRWGGKEPLLLPDIAMEVSVWYEGMFRTKPGFYGLSDDRSLEPNSHLFWMRGLLFYTLPELKHTFHINLTGGGSIHPDRLSAYRLGGFLPFAAEFPLALPGYYHQELSAQTFGLFGAGYTLPLDAKKTVAVSVQVASALVDYIEGMSQPGSWNTGVGGGIVYRSPSGAWQLMAGYGYGVNAIRSHGRGAHSIGMLLQFDLARGGIPLFEPGDQPVRSRWLDRIFRTDF